MEKKEQKIIAENNIWDFRSTVADAMLEGWRVIHLTSSMAHSTQGSVEERRIAILEK